MATNIDYSKESDLRLELDLGTSASSGDIFFLGDMAVLVLQDTDSDDKATCELIGIATVANLSVVGANGSGNVAVSIGDSLYLDGSAINRDETNGKLIGYALGAVSSGATTAISVALDAAFFDIVKAAQITSSGDVQGAAFTDGTNRMEWGAAAPAAGTYAQGDIVFNTGAAAAGQVGWVCTVAGTPGTWKTFGTIES